SSQASLRPIEAEQKFTSLAHFSNPCSKQQFQQAFSIKGTVPLNCVPLNCPSL
ncbi:MAG: hypothetical protein ACI9MB_001694, partial [Verrucomicrobiales bacterium]